MTDVMRVRSAEKKALVPGAWVRMRRNDIYKDDLAQVRIRLPLVPIGMDMALLYAACEVRWPWACKPTGFSFPFQTRLYAALAHGAHDSVTALSQWLARQA